MGDQAQTEPVAAWMRDKAGAEEALVQRVYPGIRRDLPVWHRTQAAPASLAGAGAGPAGTALAMGGMAEL